MNKLFVKMIDFEFKIEHNFKNPKIREEVKFQGINTIWRKNVRPSSC